MAIIEGADLSGAVADENTIWPGGEQGFDLEANRLAAAWARRAGVIFEKVHPKKAMPR